MELREYQLRAIKAWTCAGYCGIWSMATGTGKTITALHAISDRVGNNNGSVLIIVPSQDLVDQWNKVIFDQNLPAIIVRCYSENAKWKKEFSRAIVQKHLPTSERRPLYLIATASTVISDDFVRLLSAIPSDQLLVVGDEVHRLGAKSWKKVFFIKAGLGHLGLSATPLRQWDEIGTEAIHNYFGKIIFNYGLQEAMNDGWLSPYDYNLKLVGLEPEERAEYREITSKITSLAISLSRNYDMQTLDLQELLRLTRLDGNQQLELLLYARADVIKGAIGKLRIMQQLAEDQNISSCMVYCNDEQQVEKVLEILKQQNRTAIGFTSSRLSGFDRPDIIDNFKSGLFDFIVAIRCLDEGIDIPDVRMAIILASSKTEREWIQRRGRLLRLAIGKDKAIIYDCIVIPSRIDDEDNIIETISPIEVSIIQSELSRAREFARSALNSNEAIIQIEQIRQEVLKSIY